MRNTAPEPGFLDAFYASLARRKSELPVIFPGSETPVTVCGEVLSPAALTGRIREAAGAVPDFDAYLESIEENVRKFQSLILHDDPHAAELNEEIRNIHAVYAERSTPAGFMRILASLLDLLATLEQDGFVSSGNGEKMSNRKK